MTDNDFIIEEPETLDIPVKKETVVAVEPKEEILDFGPSLNSNPVPKTLPVEDGLIVEPTPQPSINVEPLAIEVEEVVTPVVENVTMDNKVNISVEPVIPEALSIPVVEKTTQPVESASTTPIYNELAQTSTSVSNQNTLKEEVTVASVNTTPVTQESIIKEVASATPNKINDDVLKVEDLFLTNNLAEEIKRVEEERDEEAQSKKARNFIIAIFILLGLTILLLPILTNVFN